MGLTSLTILVFERENSDTGIRSALERDKHEVHVAQDPITARAMARIHRFDAVVVEAALGDEAALARELRRQWLAPAAVILGVAKDAAVIDQIDHDASFDISLRLPIDTDLLSGLLHYLRSLRIALSSGGGEPRGTSQS